VHSAFQSAHLLVQSPKCCNIKYILQVKIGIHGLFLSLFSHTLTQSTCNVFGPCCNMP
jgi:hypothetical protein